MKNPNSARGARAFRVTSTATLNSSIDATPCPYLATHFQRRFWRVGAAMAGKSDKHHKRGWASCPATRLAANVRGVGHPQPTNQDWNDIVLKEMKLAPSIPPTSLMARPHEY
jgi:hypothetical protein